VILIAQRLAFFDVQDLSHIALRVSPYKLVAPGLIDYFPHM